MTHLTERRPFRLRTDHNITTRNTVVSEADIRDIHAVPEQEGAGDGITVAVMDSGLDTSHPLFEDAETETYDFTDSGQGDVVGHGTACCGLIAQHAPSAKIVSLRIFGETGSTGFTPIRNAYEWLIDHANEIDVVNMSWGANQDIPEINRYHDRLISAGIQDVVAAGNSGAEGGSPATARDAFSAGAIDEACQLTRFSSYNPERENPDLSALGKDIRLARADGTAMGVPLDEEWTKASGTSFSAPIVSALIVRYLSDEGHAPVSDFIQSARDIEATPRDGAGIADYTAATERLDHRADGSVWSFANGDSIYVDENFLGSGEYSVTLEERDDGTPTLIFSESQ